MIGGGATGSGALRRHAAGFWHRLPKVQRPEPQPALDPCAVLRGGPRRCHARLALVQARQAYAGPAAQSPRCANRPQGGAVGTGGLWRRHQRPFHQAHPRRGPLSGESRAAVGSRAGEQELHGLQPLAPCFPPLAVVGRDGRIFCTRVCSMALWWRHFASEKRCCASHPMLPTSCQSLCRSTGKANLGSARGGWAEKQQCSDRGSLFPPPPLSLSPSHVREGELRFCRSWWEVPYLYLGLKVYDMLAWYYRHREDPGRRPAALLPPLARRRCGFLLPGSSHTGMVQVSAAPTSWAGIALWSGSRS